LARWARRAQVNLHNPWLFVKFNERISDQICNDACHGGILLTELTITHLPEKRGMSRKDIAPSPNSGFLEIQYETAGVVQPRDVVFRWTID
jgi:hypothetical protein